MSEINWNELKDKAHSNAVKHGFLGRQTKR